MKNKKIDGSGDHKMAIGLGIASVVAAAAGAYFLYGSAKGPARRKAVKTWIVKMKGDVMSEVENMKELSEESYHSAVDKIANKYSQIKDIDTTELATTVKQLKGHWKDIKKEAEKAIKKGVTIVKS